MNARIANAVPIAQARGDVPNGTVVSQTGGASLVSISSINPLGRVFSGLPIGRVKSGKSSLKDFYNFGDNDYVGAGGAGYLMGQVFTASSSYTATSCSLKMRRAGGLYSALMTISIRATSANLPTGSDLASGTINYNTISTTATWYSIVFINPLILISGTKYVLILDSQNVVAADIEWRCVDPNPTYSGGTEVETFDGGLTWNATPTFDQMFEIYGV